MAAAFDPYHKWLAIPPEDQPPNHYRLLALTLYESDPDVIANATDQRMTHVKSFQSGKHSAASQKLLNEVAKAKVCLLNAEKKAEYDQALREQLAPVVAKPAPVRVAEPAEIAPASHTEAISLLNRLQEKVQPWHIIAAAAAALVLLLIVAVTVAFLLGGGPEEVAETEPRNTQGEPNPPVPLPPEVVARPPDTEPKPLETEPEPPPEVAVTPPEPPDTKPEPPPEVDPPAPEPEPFLSGEALAEAAGQFQETFSQATAPADFKAVAQQGLTLLDHAIVDGNHELAKKTAAAALAAARKAEDGELSGKVTLRFLDVQKPLTESMKEEARKRLDAAGGR